jgi:hypothetical protein
MRRYRQLIPTSILLASAACSRVPPETAMPRPAEVLLRVTTYAACLEGTACAPASASRPTRGNLMFVDADSLVMFDMAAAKRVTVRPGAGVLVELYRGQRRSFNATAKGAAKGALVGAAVGAGEGLLTVGLGKLLGSFWGEVDVAEAVKTGVVVGTAGGSIDGGQRAAREGEPVWERVSLFQLRQELCRCANPELTKGEPAVRLIPGP